MAHLNGAAMAPASISSSVVNEVKSLANVPDVNVNVLGAPKWCRDGSRKYFKLSLHGVVQLCTGSICEFGLAEFFDTSTMAGMTILKKSAHRSRNEVFAQSPIGVEAFLRSTTGMRVTNGVVSP